VLLQYHAAKPTTRRFTLPAERFARSCIQIQIEMNIKASIIIYLLIIVSSQSYAQDSTEVSKPSFFKRYWQSLINGNVDRTHEKPFDMSLAIAPSYSREGGFGLGCSATGLYRMDMRDSTTLPSNVTLNASASLNGFFSIIGNGINYFKDGKTRLAYGARFTRKVLDFWGTRFDACASNPTSEYDKIQVKVDADYNYCLGKHFYFGAVAALNYTTATKILNPDYLEGQKTGYYLTGLGGSFQIDTRDNPTNPRRGLYLLLRETIYPEFLGTADMTNWSTTFTLCGYQPLWKGGLLAGDIYAQFNSKDAPWTLREELGGVTGRMRGYYAGRYIDSNYISIQMELRQHLISRFGCVAWVGAGTVFPSLKEFKWSNILPNYGIGLRVEFKHNINLRVDFGMGRQTAGFSFGFSEAF